MTQARTTGGRTADAPGGGDMPQRINPARFRHHFPVSSLFFSGGAYSLRDGTTFHAGYLDEKTLWPPPRVLMIAGGRQGKSRLASRWA